MKNIDMVKVESVLVKYNNNLEDLKIILETPRKEERLKIRLNSEERISLNKNEIEKLKSLCLQKKAEPSEEFEDEDFFDNKSVSRIQRLEKFMTICWLNNSEIQACF